MAILESIISRVVVGLVLTSVVVGGVLAGSSPQCGDVLQDVQDPPPFCQISDAIDPFGIYGSGQPIGDVDDGNMIENMLGFWIRVPLWLIWR